MICRIMLPLPGSRYARTVVMDVVSPSVSGLRRERRLAEEIPVNRM
jgi:hypothetical protein